MLSFPALFVHFVFGSECTCFCTDFSKLMRYYSSKMEGVKPTSSSQPTEEGASGDVAIATEVQQTNRLLEIESMDWARQLKQAVSVTPLLFAPIPPFYLNISLCDGSITFLSYRVSKMTASLSGRLAAFCEILRCVQGEQFPEKS